MSTEPAATKDSAQPKNYTNGFDSTNWISSRARTFSSGGIRRVFQLAAQLENPINLAIGQADFPVPQPIKEALKQAVDNNHNDYALAQGLPALRRQLKQQIDAQYPDQAREVFVTSGTSAGLTLACLAMIDPGDEVIFFDPYFALYPALVHLAGGVPVKLSTYPDFRIDIDKLENAITPRTKMIIVNSPANPTGCCLTEEENRRIAEVARRHQVALVSDEIYSRYSYDRPHGSPASTYDSTIVIDGFSKSHAMAGLRLAFVHGPAEIIESMIQLQQFTFVCAPHPVQWAGLSVLESNTKQFVSEYQKKRDWLVERLDKYYEISKPSKDAPGGAFYLFPKVPWGCDEEFFQAALGRNMILIPGSVFSEHDTHFRLSYAVSDDVLQQGAELLVKLAQNI